MALLSIRVPHDTARLLSSLDVPGEKEDVAYMHVTLIYLGEEEDVSMDDILRAIGATYRVTSTTKPFMLKTNSIAHFTGDGEKVPIICPIESQQLHDFQARLRQEFDADFVPYSKKFPDYRPHATLAYAEAPLEEDVDQAIDPALEWGAHSVTLWAGRHGDEKLACDFALTMGKTGSVTNAVKAALFKERVKAIV
jgi:2'-5' RNA ligase